MAKSDQSVYAAAQGREFLRNALDGKSNEYIREFAGLIDDPEVLDLLNYYCGVYADHGENFLDERVAELLIRNSATRMTDRAFREGNVSQLQGMVGLTDRSRDGGELVERVAARLANEGAIGLVFGSPGSGKTAITTDTAMTWKARTGGTIIGNTDWDGFDEHVTSDVDLLEAMANTRGQVLAVLDEIAQDLSGFGEGNKAAEQFSDDLLFVRKRRSEFGPHPMKGSVLMVAHTRTKTAKEFRRIATFGIEKPKRNDPGFARLLDSDGGKDVWEELDEFKGITDSSWNYDEYDPSEFAVERIGGDDTDEHVDLERRAKIETVVRMRLRDDPPTYREIGQAVGYGKDWVGERWREYQDGDYDEWLDLDNDET